jgi:hypothetical protein
VHKDGATPYVFVMTNGHAERRAVKLGAVTGADIEILAGVRSGEHVVIGADKPLTDGTAVREKPAS